MMTIFYERHPKYPESVLIRKFIGEINVENIIDSWEYLIENKMITDSIKGVINDLVGCKLNMNISSFEKLMVYLKSHECFVNIKLAVVCEDPRTIVFPILGENKESKLKIKAFSTFAAASDWVARSY